MANGFSLRGTMKRILEARLGSERAVLAGQLIRYAIAGGIITLLFALSYWLLAEFAGLDPLVANSIAFLFFSLVSYLTHGRYSFAGHGTRDRQAARMTRFLLVNLAGYFLNQGWILLLVKELSGPNWWPTLPMIFVTPLLTFALHRRYVYH